MKNFRIITPRTEYNFIEAEQIQVEGTILICITNNRIVAAFTEWLEVQEIKKSEPK